MHGFILIFSGTNCGKDGGAGEGDHGKSFQEDKQVPHTPGLQQVGSQLMKINTRIFISFHFVAVNCFFF